MVSTKENFSFPYFIFSLSLKDNIMRIISVSFLIINNKTVFGDIITIITLLFLVSSFAWVDAVLLNWVFKCAFAVV